MNTNSQIVSSETNIAQTTKMVTTMMNEDNVNEQTRTAVLSMINLALSSEQYINTIKQQVKLITVDGVFDQKDIPSILTIVLQSKTFLQSVLNNSASVANNLNMHILKYVIFAVIHYVLSVEQPNSSAIASLESTFSTLWTLVAFNPQELMTDVRTLSNKCFPCLARKSS